MKLSDIVELFQKLIDLYNKNREIIPDWANYAIGILLGVFFIVALLVLIWQLLRLTPLSALAFRFPAGLSRVQDAVSESLDDPIEHRCLNHVRFVLSIIFSASAFTIFFAWTLITLLLLAFSATHLSGFKPILGAGFNSLLFLFAWFFKAETGRAIVRYRDWRNESQ